MFRPVKHSKPLDYLSPRQQGRLLLLVLSLGLILILANEARNPAKWAWFEQMDEATESKPAPTRRAARPPEDSPDVFRVSDSESPEPAAKNAPTEQAGRYFPGVKIEWLEAIEDNTVFRPQENQAWFGLLRILARTDPATLDRASIGRVTRLQLAEQSAAYRGEVVSLRGTVRRVDREKAEPNESGIEGYYQVWLQPKDSPDWLVVVYCLTLPEGFPVGEKLSEPVGATGFYFKAWVYPSQRGAEVAPLVLARTLSWQRPVAEEAPLGGSNALLLVVGTAAVLAAAAVVYVWWRTGTRGSPRPPRPDVVFPDLLAVSFDPTAVSLDPPVGETGSGDASAEKTNPGPSC